MRRRLALGWFGIPVLALVVGCGAETGRGLSNDDWATITTYQREVNALQTQVGAVITAVPTLATATPAVAMGESWKVTIATATRRPSVADPSAASLQARGVFVVLRLAVVNAGLEPVARFPWWSLRLRDGAGRLFTPQESATLAYVAGDRTLDRPEAYQPGLTYREAVVFDVPPDASGWRLQADDGSLDLPVPAFAPPVGTPAATPAAGASAPAASPANSGAAPGAPVSNSDVNRMPATG
jgi:hypothetical protein